MANIDELIKKSDKIFEKMFQIECTAKVIYRALDISVEKGYNTGCVIPVFENFLENINMIYSNLDELNRDIYNIKYKF